MTTAGAATAGRTVLLKGAFAFLQKIGKSLMLPVAVLPVAGLLLGIGAAELPLAARQVVSELMKNSGDAIFGNMALIFAIGVALGFTDNDGVAAVAATIGYVVMLATMGVMAGLVGPGSGTIMGIQSMQTGVFGGILAGGLAAAMFNRFYQISLPPYLGFFAGKRFVPIVTALARHRAGSGALGRLAADPERHQRLLALGGGERPAHWPPPSTASSSGC